MEQRPQRVGYSDMNERQAEGVPALESEETAGQQPQLPDLGNSGVVSDPATATEQPDANEEAETPEAEPDESEPA